MKQKTYILIALIFLFSACSEEDNDLYQAAKNMNTSGAYEVYLKKYPNGIRAKEIKDSLQSCIENESFNEIKKSNTIGAYLKYINSEDISEKFKQQAKDSVIAIREKNYFVQGKAEGNLYLLNTVIKEFPNGKYYHRAQYLIDSIKTSGKEKTEEDFTKPEGTFTDKRDGTNYKWIKLDKQIWMAENLKFDSPDGSTAYNNDPNVNGAVFGLLYTWQTAKESCPAGWHLPSDKEWDELENFLGGKGVAATQLRAESSLWDSYETQYTKSCGFNALPGGDLDIYKNKFANIGKFANFWTSTIDKNKNAIYRFIKNDQTIVFRVHYNINNSNSVRCIKD